MWGLLRELSICPDVYPQPCAYTETPDFQRKPGVGMRGAKGIRTPDLLIANETRYQLRHSPMGGFSLAQHAVRVNSASHALAAYSPAACLFTRRLLIHPPRDAAPRQHRGRSA